MRAAAPLVLLPALLLGGAAAARGTVAPGEDIGAAIASEAPGGVVELLPGLHRGPVSLDRAVALVGQEGAVLEGPGNGSVVTITAEGAAVRNLTIRGSGSRLEAMDSAVLIRQSAKGAVVEGNRIEGNLFGVYVHGAEGGVVRGNTITGRSGGRMSERGDGVSVWNAPGARVENNDIRFGRDGIFVKVSRRNLFAGNRLRDLRFAIHYMYANDSEVSGNASFGNHAGYAIMYSQRLRVRGNLSDGDRDHGLLFNYANGSEITGNRVIGRAGGFRADEDSDSTAREHMPAGAGGGTAGGPAPGKCVFIYNSNRNRFTGNRFEGCGIGVHFTAGSEGNAITGNAFIGNRTQVKYVGTRHLDWSRDGRGNYWSDNPAFDLDRDGIADAAYRPNDLVDQVLWTAPRAKLLLNSPAVQVLRWAQSQFPAILPGGVVDSRPLITAPPLPDAAPRWRP
ncbi:nitrous oxide reductase family maturation protein NosD [Falsiroseomonas bella]|uniref:Nitrous oxide reductase family maturation protein NosD n=1 Tax=Falsiroseomonas bella TaxID=2184016 RepID=A0A317F9V1_9PROT|nr:nitrous oxide reductase family maturation protein NosD [Falsiroseomonas bella]PWS35911.1 nitrous oxide reductase family maturation protein NosD [Falsiroseomonas bella]